MKELLQKNILFADLSDSELEQSLELMDALKREYKKGDFLRSAGEPSCRFGLVLYGSVQACCDDIDGNTMIMANVVPGETFGESLCYLGIAESPVYIRAFSDTSVLWLSTSKLGDCSCPLSVKMLSRLSEMLARRALAMNDRIQILSKPTLRDKLTAFFTQWERNCGSSTFSIPFDRESMAVYLGVNRASLSRELSAMQKEGRIEFYKNSFRLKSKE